MGGTIFQDQKMCLLPPFSVWWLHRCSDPTCLDVVSILVSTRWLCGQNYPNMNYPQTTEPAFKVQTKTVFEHSDSCVAELEKWKTEAQQGFRHSGRNSFESEPAPVDCVDIWYVTYPFWTNSSSRLCWHILFAHFEFVILTPPAVDFVDVLKRCNKDIGAAGVVELGQFTSSMGVTPGWSYCKTRTQFLHVFLCF